MGETIDTAAPMSVAEARRRLRDTSGMSSQQIDALQGALGAFRATRPQNQQCAACGCCVWSEHETAAGASIWACRNCHRSASLTAEQWRAEYAREREAAEAAEKAAAAAAPRPRDTLKQALARRAEANATILKLERALPAARSAVTEAQERHDHAAAALAEIEGGAAERVATSFFEGKTPSPAPSPAAARAELAAAVDALVIAKNARTILGSKLDGARAELGFATDRAKKAARGVLAAEQLENLVTAATEARTQYIDVIGSLAWLVQHHALPDGDARARQLVADANTPPSAWPDAATAGTAQMENALAALLADAEAVI